MKKKFSKSKSIENTVNLIIIIIISSSIVIYLKKIKYISICNNTFDEYT